MDDLKMPEPVAWADDAASQGGVGNVSSATAKQYWAISNWVDKSRSERLKHPLFTADQLRAYAAAAVAQAVAAERERLMSSFMTRAEKAHEAGNYAMRDELRAAAFLVQQDKP